MTAAALVTVVEQLCGSMVSSRGGMGVVVVVVVVVLGTGRFSSTRTGNVHVLIFT